MDDDILKTGLNNVELFRLLLHDLQTPIGAIINYSELLNDILLQEEGVSPADMDNLKTYARIIKQEGEVSFQYIRLLSEYLSPSFEAVRRQVNLQAFIESIVKRYSKANIFIRVQLDSILKSEVICIDLLLVRLVLETLLNNAVKHIGTNSGNIIVSLYKSDDFLRITVQDDGPGIPEDVQRKIFQKRLSTGGPGMGIGLLLSYRLKIVARQIYKN